MQVEVLGVLPEALSAAPDGEPSASVAQRVTLARAHALDGASARFLQTAAARLGWSARGFHRVLRVARSIADLAGSERVITPHVAEAIQYRRVLHRP